MTFLSDVEHRAMDLTGELMRAFVGILGEGLTREHDLREFAQRLHVIQNMILAQAAGRAYPDRYRLLGKSHTGQTIGPVVAYLAKRPDNGQEFAYLPDEVTVVREVSG